MTDEEISKKEMIGRFKMLQTAAINDILDQKGLFHQVLPPQIQAIEKGMRVAGPALTIKGTPTVVDKPEYFQLAMQAYEMLEQGQIVVFDTTSDQATAHWGEMISTTTRAKGCGGAVIDGGVRDVDEIERLGFPVFARYRTPSDIRGRWRYVEINIQIRIGETIINPGDWVIGDSNGVVVVPKELSVEVLLRAEKVLEVEKKIWEELEAGQSPIQVFAKYGRF